MGGALRKASELVLGLGLFVPDAKAEEEGEEAVDEI